eukprot:gene1799-33219_t
MGANTNALGIALLLAFASLCSAMERWELGIQLIAEDKGWYGPAASGADESGGGSGRSLSDANKEYQLGKAEYASLSFSTSEHSVNVDTDHWMWDAEQADPSKKRRRVCRTTRGDWCQRFMTQPILPFKVTPRGNKPCQNNCNGVGSCNYDIGLCDCPAGWRGDDCSIPDKRPCTNGTQRPEGQMEPHSHIDKDGRDLNWLAPGWSASRCAGICDADIAMCWCDGKNKKYSWIPAPDGSPPGTPPIQRGRPLSEWCGKVKENHEGKKLDWGNVPYNKIYGQNGWCEADRGETCDFCMIDGLTGEYCDEIVESYCPNQCSGHGECVIGFCRCHPGWYGTDCARPAGLDIPGVSDAPDSMSGKKPWLQATGLGVPPPAALDGKIDQIVAVKGWIPPIVGQHKGQAADGGAAAGRKLSATSEAATWKPQSAGVGGASEEGEADEYDADEILSSALAGSKALSQVEEVSSGVAVGAAESVQAIAGGRRLSQVDAAGGTEPASSKGMVGRRRPFIYIYDVPPAYTTRMLQYRLIWKVCVWRHFKSGNETGLNDWIYGVEAYFHEMLMASPHRTFEPAEADFFYVPIYVTCYFWPTLGFADMPFWYSTRSYPRPMHGANMMNEALGWIKTQFPFWNKTGGKDHIWLTTADEGACWMPTEIFNNSIILTHWGRLEPNHTSGTAFNRDNYDESFFQPIYQPEDWRNLIKGHACYDPNKDLVIPSLKPPSHYSSSPLMGAEPLHRDILLFFRGDIGGGHRTAKYSRGIRQKVYGLSLEENWRQKDKILIGGSHELPGEYTEYLARSIFCLVAPGDGWSARAEDAVLHGCIPLVIMDNVHAVFESILDWDTFSLRINEASIPHIPKILKSISSHQISRMQRRLAQVWHRFSYQTGRLLQDAAAGVLKQNLEKLPPSNSTLPEAYPIQRVTKFPVRQDAFSTIMQWLYAKLPDV